jgi:hypothetical protein
MITVLLKPDFINLLIIAIIKLASINIYFWVSVVHGFYKSYKLTFTHTKWFLRHEQNRAGIQQT